MNADTRFNLDARFLPMDLAEEGTLPCVEIAGVQVYVYFKRGVLTISAHFDTADDAVQTAEHTVPVRVVMGGGETVFATEDAGLKTLCRYCGASITGDPAGGAQSGKWTDLRDNTACGAVSFTPHHEPNLTDYPNG